MTFDEFKSTLAHDTPPDNVAATVKALWMDANGRWDHAHKIVQDISSADAAWVHAYLHRKEGDLSNAAYWYRRAGRQPTDAPLEQEWEEIVKALLKK